MGGGRSLLFALLITGTLLPILVFKFNRSHWIFPLGISFVTVQSIGYIVDVYKKKIEVEQSLLNIALFVSFFPAISSGPIQRAGNLLPQLKKVHSFDYNDLSDGMKLFAWGLLKKLVIADRIALYVNSVYGNIDGSKGLALLFATFLYSFQIYCDFSGYSDMAIGVAKYCGFDIGKNFDHPYLAQSVGDFWRRWHISLSSCLRDYVYIPLGGSRVALPRIYFNLLATFFVSGTWHGTGFNFIIWGVLHGLYLCVERATRHFSENLNFSRVFKIAITFCLVSFAWIFFRVENAAAGFAICKKIAFAPFEIFQFFDLNKSVGLKNAIRAMLSISPETCGNLKGMTKIIFLVSVLFVIEVATLKKDGLNLLRSMKTDIRWLLYIICLLVLLKVLPLKLTFEEQRNYSTNFIYQNF